MVKPRRERDGAPDQASSGKPRRGRGRRAKRPPKPIRLRRGGPPFGRDFFEGVLPAMVHACACTDAEEPQVLIHLGDGTTIDVHRLVGISERFVVLQAFGEGPGEDGIERTKDDLIVEAVPYDLVIRASVKKLVRAPSRKLGFAVANAPSLDGAQPAAEAKDPKKPAARG